MTSVLRLDLPGGGKMPLVGFGCSGFRGSSTSEQVEQVLETALENGYRHFDTAYIYQTEQQIGNVVKRWLDAGKLKREDLFIVTKLPAYGTHQDRVELFMKKSLENLQLDYVDLYLIHNPFGVKYDEKIAETKSIAEMDLEPVNDHVAIWKKMEKQVDAGRAKAIGLSNFNIPQIEKILANARIKPANLQVLVNVYHQQKEIVKFCKSKGITVVAYSPLGRPNGKPRRSNEAASPSLPLILEDPVVNEIAKKYSKTTSQILLRFIVQRGVAVIPKSTSPERQRENLSVVSFTLSDEDMKKLEALDRNIAYLYTQKNLRAIPTILRGYEPVKLFWDHVELI